MARTVPMLDRLVGRLSPGWQLRRMRARAQVEIMQRHYEAASTGRRTMGWRRPIGDANAVMGPALQPLRDAARDLVRNNPYAESALSTIADHTVGWGITGKPRTPDARTLEAWRRWSESTDCDADGRHDFAGLQKLTMRTVVEGGEIVVRRRYRLPEDGLRVPFQIQLLDADFIDTTKDDSAFPTLPGPRNVLGVRFDAIGRRIGYWLFREHPGSLGGGGLESHLVPAEQVLHIFKGTRTGQVRAPSWFAPTLLRFKDFDEFEDATLMKQKIAACLAAFITDPNGSNAPLGVAVADGTSAGTPELDQLGPGALINLPVGQDVQIVQPPTAADYDPYSKNVLRAIATGLGVTYEDLTGDYQNLPFSAARMSRLRHEARIHDWRWRIIIPQFCNPVWSWFMQAAAIMRQVPISALDMPAEWTPQPLPMVDPSSEGLAAMRNIRAGLTSWSETVRERGFDPGELAVEIAADFKRLKDMGIVLDSDPSQMTQAGQAQPPPKSEEPAARSIEDDEQDLAESRARLHAVGGRR